MRKWILILVLFLLYVQIETKVKKAWKRQQPKCSYILYNNQCVHKPLLQPVNSLEIVGSLVIAMIVGLCNAGGLEAGFLVIPFFFNYSLVHTIENIYIIVFSGSIGNLLTGCLTKHSRTLLSLFLNVFDSIFRRTINRVFLFSYLSLKCHLLFLYYLLSSYGK